jgi:hypothetical protein
METSVRRETYLAQVHTRDRYFLLPAVARPQTLIQLCCAVDTGDPHAFVELIDINNMMRGPKVDIQEYCLE